MSRERVRLADLLAALSVATDVGGGQEPEKAIRACLVATALARRMDVPEDEVSDVYYTALLRHLGCTATAHEEAYLYGGDELISRPAAERVDFGNSRENLSLLLQLGKGTGFDRLRYLLRAMRAEKESGQTILGAICEVAARLADRLDLGPGVQAGVFQAFERWDGKGAPRGLAGDAVALPARLAEIGHQVVIFDRLAGPDAATEMVRRRSGGWFDPAVAETFVRYGRDILREIDGGDVWTAVVEAEPEPPRTVGTDAGLDRLAEAFADMVDLKSPYLLGHSGEVADLSERAAKALGLDDVDRVRRAALFHDLGRVAVSSAVWDKRERLSTSEWERVRLHPYQTERILARSSTLEPLARTAGMHHERQDGSGYHRSASGAEMPAAARVLAAADAFQAMTQERPHRPALAPEEAAEALAGEGRSGRLDTECVRAVIEAAGQRVARSRTAWPADLSDREVEVLRLVARGLSNREIASGLFISARTAEHHVQHIYTKIGSSTRASAAMFAVEHGLLRD